MMEYERARAMDAAAACQDLISLSSYLGFAPQHLFKLVKHPSYFYRPFIIKKKNGSNRQIYCPKAELRGVQRAILDQILSRVPIHTAAHAYVKGRSIITCANQLSGQNSLLKLDIKDFFPSIDDKRVFGLFRSIGFCNKSAFILTRLTTFHGHAIQGAPTSPCISNLVSRGLDTALTSLSQNKGARYHRYSDDLFFVSDEVIPWKSFRASADAIVAKHGFSLNPLKMKVYRAGGQKQALGLRLDDATPQLLRRTKRQYRAIFHKAAMYPNWGRKQIEQLEGITAWYKSISGRDSTFWEYQSVIASLRSIKAHEPYST